MAPLTCMTLTSTGPSRDEQRRGRRPEEIRLFADLRTFRAEVDRARSRCVAPYPFTGRRMKFQEDGATLELLSDGRFIYAQKELLSVDRLRVTAYEGVLAGAVPGGESEHASPVVVDADTNVARIELRGIVRHEEEGPKAGGNGMRPILVERADVRFRLTISPFFAVKHAEVEPLFDVHSSNGWPPKVVQLPCLYADAICGTGDAASSPRASAKHSAKTRDHGGAFGSRCQQLQKFANLSGIPQRGLEHYPMASPAPRGFRRLASSSSAPQLACSLPPLAGTMQSASSTRLLGPGPCLRAPAVDRALLQPHACTGPARPAKFTKHGLDLGGTSKGICVGASPLKDLKRDLPPLSSWEPIGMGGVTLKPSPPTVDKVDWAAYYKQRSASILAAAAAS